MDGGISKYGGMKTGKKNCCMQMDKSYFRKQDNCVLKMATVLFSIFQEFCYIGSNVLYYHKKGKLTVIKSSGPYRHTQNLFRETCTELHSSNLADGGAKSTMGFGNFRK